MKTLLILRHAKSDRSDATLPDHARPLAPRGEADAPRMGAAIAALGVMPDCVIASTAVRARETAHLATAAMGYRGPITERDAVYEASVATLLAVLRDCDDGDGTVLLVGHNPGMEELVGLLTAGTDAEWVVRMATAALAYLSLDIAGWGEITPACGVLEWLLTPRIVASLTGTRRGKRDDSD